MDDSVERLRWTLRSFVDILRRRKITVCRSPSNADDTREEGVEEEGEEEEEEVEEEEEEEPVDEDDLVDKSAFFEFSFSALLRDRLRSRKPLANPAVDEPLEDSSASSRRLRIVNTVVDAPLKACRVSSIPEAASASSKEPVVNLPEEEDILRVRE